MIFKSTDWLFRRRSGSAIHFQAAEDTEFNFRPFYGIMTERTNTFGFLVTYSKTIVHFDVVERGGYLP